MRRTLVTVALVAALLPAAASSTTITNLHPKLAGTCLVENRFDALGTLLSSTETCNETGTCTCNGVKTQLVVNTRWYSAGNGGPGAERGTLVATAKGATVTLNLKGTRDGTGAASGKWALGKVTGAARTAFRASGTYTAMTVSPASELGPTLHVHVTATISCWSC